MPAAALPCATGQQIRPPIDTPQQHHDHAPCANSSSIVWFFHHRSSMAHLHHRFDAHEKQSASSIKPAATIQQPGSSVRHTPAAVTTHHHACSHDAEPITAVRPTHLPPSAFRPSRLSHLPSKWTTAHSTQPAASLRPEHDPAVRPKPTIKIHDADHSSPWHAMEHSRHQSSEAVRGQELREKLRL
ncbi:hypothetical protein ACLOJK_018807 [Asimina triloba]